MTTAAARPRRRLSADARREQLESAAIQVVARDGFAATTADAIARCAGVSKGLLWHYFADLDDLLANTARHSLAVLESAVAHSIDLDAPLPDLLRAAIARAAQLPSTHGPVLRAAREISTNLRAADGTPRLGEDEYDRLYAGQAALMRRGQDDGHLRPDLDPHLLAVTYQGMVDTMLGHLDHYPQLDATAYAEHVAAVLLGGIEAQAT